MHSRSVPPAETTTRNHLNPKHDGCSRFKGPLVALLQLLAVLTFPFSCFGLTNGLALTPPMGLNPWYHCTSECSDIYVKKCADVMATNGMLAAGYQYINLDDCWFSARDEQGRLVEDRRRFPGGVTNLANYVRSKGFKFGLYLPATRGACCPVGTVGFEVQDAATLMSYGTEFIKYDFTYQKPGAVAAFWNAIKAAGGNMVYSLSCGPFESWNPHLGNSWRTSADWYGSNWTNVMQVLEDNTRSAAHAGPSRWNDPDFLHIGKAVGGGTMTEDEYRSHFSMWCMMAAPLILSTDVTTLSTNLLAILLAEELISVDQDPAGNQGIPVESTLAPGGNLEVWCKHLGFDGTTKAVALLNRSDAAANITAHWQNLGLPSGSATVRDLWARRDLGYFNDSFTTNVPSHGTVVLKVVSAPPPELRLTSAGQEIILSWPLAASNFVLETTSFLLSNALWTPVTAEPAVSGTSLVLTNCPTEASGFYRLRSP